MRRCAMLSTPGNESTKLSCRSSLSPLRRNTRTASWDEDTSCSIPSKRGTAVRLSPIAAAQTRAYRGYIIPARPSSRGSAAVRLDNSWSDADLFPDLKHRLSTAASGGGSPTPAAQPHQRARTTWDTTPWYPTNAPRGADSRVEAHAPGDPASVANSIKLACGMLGSLNGRDISCLARASLRAASLPQPVLDVLDAWCVLHCVRETRWKPWTSGNVTEVAHRSFGREITRPDATAVDPPSLWLVRVLRHCARSTPHATLMSELFGPATRPSFTAASVAALHRRCPCAKAASLLCDLICCSIQYLQLSVAEQAKAAALLGADSGITRGDDVAGGGSSGARGARGDASVGPMTPLRQVSPSPFPSPFTPVGSSPTTTAKEVAVLFTCTPIRNTAELSQYWKEQEATRAQHVAKLGLQFQQAVEAGLIDEFGQVVQPPEDRDAKAKVAAAAAVKVAPPVNVSLPPGPAAGALPKDFVEHVAAVEWDSLMRYDMPCRTVH